MMMRAAKLVCGEGKRSDTGFIPDCIEKKRRAGGESKLGTTTAHTSTVPEAQINNSSAQKLKIPGRLHMRDLQDQGSACCAA
jgi:hypothetical protein